MRREILPGHVYGDVLPSGEFVATQIGSDKITIGGVGVLDAPFPQPMFNRIIKADGRLKIASKSHSPGNIWTWDAGWTSTPYDSSGVQGHAWNPDGTLVFIRPAADQESQGLRYFDPSVPAHLGNLDILKKTPGWVTGSPSYGPDSSLAHYLGVSRLFEWTKLGDVAVGQGESGGAVIQYRAKHYVIEPGDCRFIQFKRAGSLLAIAITKLLEQSVVFYWLDVGEIETLPLYEETPPPLPDPEPDPTSMKTPQALIDLLIDSGREIDKRYPGLRQASIEAWRDKTAYLGFTRDSRIGKKRNPSGRISPNAFGLKLSDGSLTAVDIVRDNPGVNEWRGEPEIYEDVQHDQQWIQPEPVEIDPGTQQPDDPKDPLPDPVECKCDEMKERLDALEARIAVLESKPDPEFTLVSDSSAPEFSTGRSLVHTHNFRLKVVRK